jgi:hypothetical protein
MPPKRRNVWSQMAPAMPAMPMSSSGGSGTMFPGDDDQAEASPTYGVPPPSADSFRRRVMPILGTPTIEPPFMDQLSTLLGRKQ